MYKENNYMKIGRNDPCPCKSGKKYKHCYETDGSACVLFAYDQRVKMLQEHQGREDEVFRFFKEVTEETTVINLTDEKGNDRMPARIQMITIFSLVDVMGSYWFEYLDQTGRTNERAQVWYDKFCATDKNKHHIDLWKDISSTRLYNFRNALVHFFGFGEASEGISIVLAPNNMQEEIRKKYEAGFLRAGHKTIVIRPRSFSDLIKEGAILMLKEWGSIITEAQTDRTREREYIEGIERVWNKVRKEGAVMVELPKTEER